MTDTRLPESWLTNAVIDALSSDALRVHFLGLMWSNANGTDGLIPDRALRYLHPDGKRQDCLDELTAANLWQQETGGHRVIGFLDSQTPADEMEEKRKIARERQRQYRQRQRDEQQRLLADDSTSRDVTRDVTHDVQRDVTHDVQRYVGQDRQGQEQANNGTEPTAKVARARDENEPAHHHESDVRTRMAAEPAPDNDPPPLDPVRCYDPDCRGECGDEWHTPTARAGWADAAKLYEREAG